MATSSTNEYQKEGGEEDNNNNNTREKVFYNDYTGYFDNLESDVPLRIQKNVVLFKSLNNMIEEYFSLANQQELDQLKKNELILEMASTMEQIYLNAGQPHLVETIGSSLILILNKKDKITSPSHIYNVLEKKYKNRYSTEVGRSKRGDIFSKRNVVYNEFRENIAGVINFLNNLPNLDWDKQDELNLLLNRFDESRIKAVNEINNHLTPSSITSINMPEEQEESEDDDDDQQPNNVPEQTESKYYKRLEQYISLLQKLKENVLRFPPSKELDEKLDQSLALEMEILYPSIDMKFKRSIAQLDETVYYADNQSLNGASSVMREEALVKDFRGDIIDPNNPYNKFLRLPHKLTPEQIDTRRPYISIIRKRMQKYQPHLFYHILWYEGSARFNHNLSMSKFARSNLLKEKV